MRLKRAAAPLLARGLGSMKDRPDSAIALLNKDGGCSIRQRARWRRPADYCVWVTRRGGPGIGRPNGPQSGIGFNSDSSGTDHFLVRSYFYLGNRLPDYQPEGATIQSACRGRRRVSTRRSIRVASGISREPKDRSHETCFARRVARGVDGRILPSLGASTRVAAPSARSGIWTEPPGTTRRPKAQLPALC